MIYVQFLTKVFVDNAWIWYKAAIWIGIAVSQIALYKTASLLGCINKGDEVPVSLIITMVIAAAALIGLSFSLPIWAGVSLIIVASTNAIGFYRLERKGE